MKTTCNYPGCNEALPPYRGQGPHPKRCLAHRGMTAPKISADDDDTPPDDPINLMIGQKDIILIIDPTGDFRPGARFNVYDLSGGISTFRGRAAECWEPGTRFNVPARGIVEVTDKRTFRVVTG